MTVAVVGLDNVLCVVTHDAAFIAPLSRAQDAKLVVEELRRRGHPRADEPAQVHRPWGSYQTMDSGDRFQTKRLVVKPGGQLSLQKHHHRSEHWIVVNGTAEVTLGQEVRLLQENESLYIPAGTNHRLRNPGKVPLRLIEVQCGPYLGEDDIVRLDDEYGRSLGD
jgi:mannose-1-phosphate guanylyltransferase/mannose-6-phosphate isomerase